MSDKTPDTDFTPPDLEELGELLPAYEMHHFIAKGGMGAVYMACQKSLDRDVAIKVLPRHFGEDDNFRKSFETEAKSMAKLNHPNLISIYDFGQVDGLLYIIMEMVQGKSLYHSAYGKTIDPEETARIVIDICHGLAHAHKHGILHRDIKPANILLAPGALPKIGDFGLAKPVEDKESGLSFGTPGYAAPEVIHNPAAVDQSTDLYSVGVIIYELLTGHLPASSYSPAATEVGCDPAFDKIIRKATHPTPAFRYRDANDMASDLEKIFKTKHGVTKASSKPSSSTAKTLLTAAPSSRHPKPITSLQTGSSSKPTSTTAPQSIKPATSAVGSNVPLIRNIIIIIALLAAIFVAWEGYKKVKANRNAEQARIEKEKAQRDKEAAEQRERERKEREASMVRKDPKEVGSTPEHLKPKEETPTEQLARLQTALYEGKRDTFPKTTIKTGDRARFYITTPMTWHDAQQFCEKHGGHLPVFAKTTDLATFTSHIVSDDPIWLGAGTAGDKKWRWIDGTPWEHEIRNTSKASYVCVGTTGILKPQLAQKKLPFYIEWMLDGSQPATLQRQLQRCAESLQSGSPEYPAGTASYDNRYYLHVERRTEWQDAHSDATKAGGHLAVPSNADENIWIGSFLSDRLEANQACWIGGIHPANNAWQWSSGEAWKFAEWKEGAPDENTDQQLACAITSSGKWDDFASDTQLDSYIIEWSKDADGMEKAPTSVVDNSDPVSGVRKKCARILADLKQEHEKQFKSNISGYEQELRSYKRSLVVSQQNALGPLILEMTNNYKDNRIPKDLPRFRMTRKLAEILNSRLEKQNRMETKYSGEVEQVRVKYRSNLKSMSEKFKSQGLNSRAKKVQNELDNTAGDTESFMDYILGGG